MSASAIAIPASPAAKNSASLTLDSNSKPGTRRRQVVVAEKKSTAEVVTEGGIPVASDDRNTVNGKDLSHTIRGESVLERPRDLSQVKKTLIASTVSPRRKKPTTRPEKARWQTILSVLTKNAVLLIVLFWMGQAIWKWADNLGPGADIPFAALDFEGRISEVEASLKKAAKMTQVQLEVMDKRTKQVEEKGVIFEKELRKIADRTDDLDKFISDLRDTSFLSKQEYETLLNELKESKSQGDSGKGLTLDDVMSYARDVVMKEIEKHAADGLGRVDYALASSGARVVRHSEPYNLGKSGSWFPVAKGLNAVHGNAQKMLEPSFGEPGQCFPLQGSSGFVEIRLRSGIIPDAVTLEHVAKSVAYDRSSAPKDCQVSGWFEGPEDDLSSRAEKMFFLKEFTYDLERSNAQTFNIETVVPGVVNMIRLDFSSNHGSSSHTCIYRFRVHGYDPGSLTAMGAQGLLR